MTVAVGQLPTTPPLPGTTAVTYINFAFAWILLEMILRYACALDGPMDGPM